LIRGQTVDIALNPVMAKDVPSNERFVPVQVDMRNVRLTDKGTPKKRNGYAEKWDLGSDFPVDFLIPENNGYAVNLDGTFYKLDTTPVNIYDTVQLQSIPTYFKWDNKLYIYAGISPLKLDLQTNQVTLVGNELPNGKFAVMVDSVAIISGYDPTEFTWLVPGNPESAVIANGAGSANVQKNGSIQNMIEYKNRIFFFKDTETEVYALSASVPRVQSGLKIDKGTKAPNSVVKANDRFYWLANDGDFYVYEGTARVLSDEYRARINEGANPTDWRGFDIRKENVIMWTNPTDGQTLLYDYSKSKWLEDNRWEGSGWQALPFNSYMELDNKQYFGSRGYDGLIHEWSADNLDDNGQPIRVLRHMKIPLSPIRARVNRIVFRGKRGVATSAVTAPVVTVRTRFDEGDWVTHENLSLGTLGDNNPYRSLYNVGMGSDLELEISEMDAVEYFMTNAYITYEELR
jgi:hypothetical protein